MKFLLLSCSTGEGHNSAARAIAAFLAARGMEYELCDPISFQSERARSTVAAAYNNLIRTAPIAFGAIYKIGALYERTGLPSPVYAANKKYAGALATYIQEGCFDAVICTHLFGMHALTAAKRTHGLSVPCFGVLTDYTAIPFYSETDLDGYFAPTEAVAEQLCTKQGIAPEKIHITGIPIDEKFTFCDRETARARLNIPGKEKVVVLLSGGAGCGSHLHTLGKKISTALDSAHRVYIFCGKNETLFARLSEEFPAGSRVIPVAFTTDVHLYIAAADVVLTKPGGLSGTEVVTCGVPLILTREIPGCETENRKLFVKNGVAVYAKTQKKMVAETMRLLDSPALSAEMRERQKMLFQGAATAQIVETILGAS